MNPSITLLHLNVLPLPLLPTPDKRGFSFSSYSSTSYLSLSPTLEKRGFSFPSSSSGFRNMIQTTAILMYTKQKPSIRAQSALQRASSAEVHKVPKIAKREKLMDKADPVQHHYTDQCVSFQNLITSKPRWMSVTNIEQQDKIKHNEESLKPRISILENNKQDC